MMDETSPIEFILQLVPLIVLGLAGLFAYKLASKRAQKRKRALEEAANQPSPSVRKQSKYS